ncbi:MAG: HTTM domain-containing protein [Kofleriaceae bacterium]
MALDWMTRLAALAVAVAALELLVMRRALSDTGVFAWSVLRRDYTSRFATLVFGSRPTLVILVLQLASALLLPWLDHPAPAWVAFATSLAISVRFRGSYNGGSDSMLLVVTLSLAVARTWPEHARIALAYCAVQLVLSYVIAGIAKLHDPAWRSGRALAILVDLPQYRVPGRLVGFVSRLSRFGSWAILAFEVAVPIAFAGELACVIVLAIGAAFHVANAVVFGLNRFLWTWLAAYPALLYTVSP